MDHATLFEPLTEFIEYSVQWSKGVKNLNLDELRKLRFEEKMTLKQLCKHYKLGMTCIQKCVRKSVQQK